MKIGKSLVILISAAAVAANVWLAYALVNTAMLLEDARTEQARLVKRNVLALEMFGESTRSPSSVNAEQLAVNAEKRGRIVKRFENAIEIDDLRIQLKDGDVVSVVFIQ